MFFRRFKGIANTFPCRNTLSERSENLYCFTLSFSFYKAMVLDARIVWNISKINLPLSKVSFPEGKVLL